MAQKIIQNHLLKGSQEFEILEDSVNVKIKPRFGQEEVSTVMLAILNSEPIITKSYLEFTSRVNNEPLLTLFLAKPNQKEFNDFVNILKHKIQDEFNSLIIVKSCNIEYKKSSYLEDELKVRSFVKSITKTSFFMNQIITKGEETIVEAQVHLVFVSNEGKPVKIPEEIYSKFKPYFCDTIKT